MKIIAMANQKGGVAKTTSTYNLAYLKAKEGNSVLMVDLDPQSSLTISCKFIPGEKEFSICDLFNPDVNPYDCGYEVEAAKLDNFYIIPSDIELASTEQNLIGRAVREKILKKQLAKFGDQFDYIFIDCPPQLSILTINALVAATNIIIPTKAEYLSYRGMRALKSTIKFIRDEFSPDLSLDGFIITMYEKNINDQKDMLEKFKEVAPILGIVKKSADTYRSVLEGTPVVMSNPKCDVSKAYQEIANLI